MNQIGLCGVGRRFGLERRGVAAAIVPLLCWGVMAGVARGQASLPVDPGEVVVTCHSGYPPHPVTGRPTYDPTRANGYVVALFDAANPVAQGAPLGPSYVSPSQYGWFPSSFHNEFQPLVGERWTAANLGEVFGLTLDAGSPPDIYVTATTVYGPFPFGPSGPGAVYRLNGVTGAITTFAQVGSPTSITGLGNICHERVHDQFFVSNLDDGLIYRLNNAGAVVGTYDHGTQGRPAAGFSAIADVPANAFTGFGRRVWGLEDYGDRLYYGVWWEDVGMERFAFPVATNPAWLGQVRPAPNIALVSNEVWSVAIDVTTGALLPATARREIVLPALGSFRTSSPVSDITFGPAGEMIIAERSMLRDAGFGQIPAHLFNPNDAHYSRTLEYTGVSGSWTARPVNRWRVGEISSGQNSAGGVDMDCDGNLWATGDALHYPFPYIYGVQRSPAGGTAAASPATITSYLIDADHNINAHDKTQIGDVSVRDDDCDCAHVTNVSLDCMASLSFTIYNRSGIDADHLRLVPVSPGSLSINPTVIPGVLPDGAGTSVKVLASGYAPGSTVCFDVQLEDSGDNPFCTVRACTTAPFCGCMEITDAYVDWYTEEQTVKYFYGFTVRNLSNEPASRIEPVASAPVTFSPPVITLSPPLAPGASRAVNMIICNASPGASQYIAMRLQRADGTTICEADTQVQLPWCDIPDPPDTGRTTPIATCCPPMDIFAPPQAVVVATICNNGSVAKTYSWSVAGLPAATPCFHFLTPSDFTPSSGTVGPVAPGACASVTIEVNCLTFGELPPVFGCAGYRVTFADLASPAVVTADGRVQSSQFNFKDITSCCPTGGVNDLNFGGSGAATIAVTTPDPMGGTLAYELVTGIVGDRPALLALSLDGQPAGWPVAGVVDVPPGGEGLIEFEVAFDYASPNLIDHVYVVADVDGDGQPELAGSATFRQAPAPCMGDVTGDGQVNFDDLNEVLAGWGGSVTPGTGGDVTGDGQVNFEDLNEVLANWGVACM